MPPRGQTRGGQPRKASRNEHTKQPGRPVMTAGEVLLGLAAFALLMWAVIRLMERGEK